VLWREQASALHLLKRWGSGEETPADTHDVKPTALAFLAEPGSRQGS
jgi:hypothetical protein